MSIGMDAFRLPNGTPVSRLGQGAWQIGDDRVSRAAEHAALRTGLELGMNLIDTAEMYGNGRSEQLVADVISGQREHVYLVSKVLPENATREGAIAACEQSLKRLKTDYLDLYLLHWRGTVPLDETLGAFDALERQGKIRHWGVSNFDVNDMEELVRLTGKVDSAVSSNQVLYNLMRRGIEYDLLLWCRTRRVPIMAYSPLEQGRLAKDKTVQAIARRLDATPAQVALAWVLRQQGVVAIPKAAHFEHVREDRGALDIELSSEDLDELDEAFPPPTHKTPLEMI